MGVAKKVWLKVLNGDNLSLCYSFFCYSVSIRLLLLQFVKSTGGPSIVKVPGDVPPARVCFFKPSSLAKGILFANFSPFSLAKGILFANFRPFSLDKGILFGQRNVKLW